MRINLRIHGLPMPDELAEYVERRTWFALGRYAPRVAALRVTLGDENGPRGGVDKVCRATATFEDGPSLTVTSNDANIRAAVDRALSRLSRSVRRSLDRRLHHNGRWGVRDLAWAAPPDTRRRMP